MFTFLGQAPALAKTRLPVQQLAFGAGGGRGRPPGRVPVVAERVATARVPGGGLPQPPLGLGLQTSLVEAGGRSQDPVTVDLVFGAGGGRLVFAVLVAGEEGVTQVISL